MSNINTALSKTLNVVRFAEHQQSLEGTVALAGMARLLGACASEALVGDVCFKLTGNVAEGFKYLTGEMKASFPLVCQRCMKPFDYVAETSFRLAIVFNEQDADSTPADCEPLLLSHPEYELLTLLEDELLLAIPTVALHNVNDCSVKKDAWALTSGEILPEKENPFATLADLKKKLKGE